MLAYAIAWGAFGILGLIAATTGRAGLRQLWQRLTRWRIRCVWYAAWESVLAPTVAARIMTHLIHTYNKLGVDDRTAAVTTALEKGIISL